VQVQESKTIYEWMKPCGVWKALFGLGRSTMCQSPPRRKQKLIHSSPTPRLGTSPRRRAYSPRHAGHGCRLQTAGEVREAGGRSGPVRSNASQERGRLDLGHLRVSNALLSMYGRCGAVEELEAVLGEPRSRQLDGCRLSQLPERVQREGGGAAVSDALGFAPNEYAFSSGLRRPGVAGPREAAPLPGAEAGLVRLRPEHVHRVHGGGARGDAVPDESTFLAGCTTRAWSAACRTGPTRWCGRRWNLDVGRVAAVGAVGRGRLRGVRADVEYPRDARGGCGGGWMRSG
jgi:hypothetical protein